MIFIQIERMNKFNEKAENDIAFGSNYKDIYIKKTMQYIETNFSGNINMGEIARSLFMGK